MVKHIDTHWHALGGEDEQSTELLIGLCFDWISSKLLVDYSSSANLLSLSDTHNKLEVTLNPEITHLDIYENNNKYFIWKYAYER